MVPRLPAQGPLPPVPSTASQLPGSKAALSKGRHQDSGLFLNIKKST